MKINLISYFLLAAYLTASYPAFAQSPSTDTDAQTEQNQTTVAEADKEQATTPARDLSIDDVFKPSEELSEDSSAPFPTDI